MVSQLSKLKSGIFAWNLECWWDPEIFFMWFCAPHNTTYFSRLWYDITGESTEKQSIDYASVEDL